MSNSKKTVTFTLQSEEQKRELQEYAKSKGFAHIGALARFALIQYVRKYPAAK